MKNVWNRVKRTVEDTVPVAAGVGLVGSVMLGEYLGTKGAVVGTAASLGVVGLGVKMDNGALIAAGAVVASVVAGSGWLSAYTARANRHDFHPW